jgi:hypothetical protein
MRLRTLGAVCATSAVAAPLPAYVSTASAQAPATAPAQTAPPAQPGAAPTPTDAAPAAAPPATAPQPGGAAPAPAGAPQPGGAAPAAAAAPAPAPGAAAPVTPPGDLRKGAMTILTDRHVHFARRYSRLLGDPLTRTERRALRAQLGQLTPYKVRVETRELREDIRHLRGRLERKLHGGAPDVPIPPQLNAIAQCESHGDPRAISSSGTYRGKYQFSFTTWAAVGGKGDPAAASETEQDRRAAILYRTAGAGQWPVCGR